MADGAEAREQQEINQGTEEMEPPEDQDVTAALPDDVLADALRRLAPRWLAASRCVCKAWRDVIDGHRLLRADLLPLSFTGIFVEYFCHDYTELFSRPTTSAPLVSGKLDYVPSKYEWLLVEDHCNGLLLLNSYHDYVVNPATRRWAVGGAATPPAAAHGSGGSMSIDGKYLVFDPTVSHHYEVFIITHISSKKHYEPENPTAWPPSPLVLDVFSSRTGRWEKRSFIREGEAARTISEVGSYWNKQYAVFWRGARYVHCQ